MKTTCLRWWSDGALERAARRAAAGWQGWCDAWGATAGRVSAVNACDVETRARSGIGVESTFERLGVILFRGEPAPLVAGSLAREVAIRAERALRVACFEAIGDDDASAKTDVSADAAIWRPWSGGIVVTLETESPNGGVVDWFLDAAQAERWVGPEVAPSTRPWTSEPVGVSTALQDRVVPLRVELEPLVIEIGQLESIACGDVVRLDHPFERPLRLRLVDAATSAGASDVCFGHIGARSGRRAVELLTELPT